jgi:hypothetical protein
MRRYLVLLVTAVVAGVLLAIAGRLPRDRDRAAPVAAPLPAASLALVVSERGMQPASASVPGGSVVTLALENRGARTVTVSLAGYEDRLAIGAIAPRGRWTGRFVADRPGEGFAWSVNGVTAGRLSVTGSHLVEGHE